MEVEFNNLGVTAIYSELKDGDFFKFEGTLYLKLEAAGDGLSYDLDLQDCNLTQPLAQECKVEVVPSPKKIIYEF